VVCRYFNSPQEAKAKLPFDAGFESVGVVAAVGAGVTGGVGRRGVAYATRPMMGTCMKHLLQRGNMMA
jgi:NADPH:quinone reductase-like Zn-dependent oxidoreductase